MNMNRTTMPCPIDGTALVPNERQGIEIDYCPTCRGVWLDRGELDKIIERSARESEAQAAPPPPQAPAPQPHMPPPQAPHPHAPHPHAQPPQYGYHDPYGHQRGYKQKRRKSFLEELFD